MLLGLNLTLAIGSVIPEPAPLALTQALQSVEITQTDQGPNGFQMTFYADRSGPFSPDYPLLSSPLLKPFNRVLLTVTFNGTPTVLMDGFITHQQLTPGTANQGGMLTVTGEDVSVIMDMVQYTLEYPALDDTSIVFLILAKYSLVGIVPEVIPASVPFVRTPDEGVWQQNETDRKQVLSLAANHGYVFYVKPGPVALTNVAYWGPPPRIGVPQKTMNVDLGPQTNVKTINFSLDAMAPTLIFGLIQDPETNIDLPIVTLMSMRPPLAAEPALTAYQPYGRKNIFYQEIQCGGAFQRGAYTVEAIANAQAITDQSTDNVVTAQGELDVLRYNGILTAPGLVGLRGAGYSYDGIYYVKSVTHSITKDNYAQKFTLTREGLGSTVPVVEP